MVEIKHSSNVLGCRIDNEIYVHPKLEEEDFELYKAIIAHELRHSEGVEIKDISIDMFNDDLKGHKLEFYKFALRHPRVLLGWLPLSKVGKHWAFDLTLTAFWLVAIFFSWFIGSSIL